MAPRAGRPRGRRAGAPASIDVSAFADIAFLLIIFFILTTTFVRVAGQKLEIPSGSSDPSKRQEKQLTVNLSATEIRYGEKSEQVTLDDLRALLLKEDFKSRKPGDRIVIIDAAPDVPYERYFRVVSAIANADGVLALLED